MNKQGVHYFTTSFVADLTFTTPLNVGETQTLPISIAMSLAPNNGKYMDLFDQYKIVGADFKMIYEGGNVLQNAPFPGGAGNIPPPDQLPILYTVPDIDDEQPLSFQDMLTHQKMRMHQISTDGKIYKKFYIPCYTENILTGVDDVLVRKAQPKKSPWLDSDAPDITHGCLKMALSGSPNTIYRFKRIMTIRFMCKNLKG